MERRLIGIATREIKRLLVGEEGSRPQVHTGKTTATAEMKAIQLSLSSQRPNPIPNFIWSHGGRRADFFLNAVYTWAVPQTAITTCMKAGQEESQSNQCQWTSFLTSVCAGFHVVTAAVSKKKNLLHPRFLRLHISHRHLTSRTISHGNFYSSRVEANTICAVQVDSRRATFTRPSARLKTF